VKKATARSLLALALSLAATSPHLLAELTEHPPEAFSGGATTVFNDGKDAYSLALANISKPNRRLFVVGNSFFNENWITAPASAQARDGLGPLFHARSCSSCHTKDGRGAPPNEGETMTGLLLRLSLPGQDKNGAPLPDPIYGGQLAVRALPGAQPEADIPIKWVKSTRTLPDGESVELRRPEFGPITWNYGPPSPGLLIGPRLAQPVYGSGLLEAIPEATLRALTDPDDSNKDGISGRLNEVWSIEFQKTMPGRFGWKANQPTLRQQTADAFLGDIGITTSIHPQEALTTVQQPTLGAIPNGGTPELSDHILDRVVIYTQALAVPARRKLTEPVVRQGEALFAKINCSACHLPELKTGNDHPLTELRDQTIRPYTDLLIHDMGEDLSDHRPDFLASGSEWRTPPLWGLGLNKEVNGNTFFLHDGRARSITEAILWHGGEAQASREAFENLTKEERAALVTFLESL
jgi:CxxC motif-containing protein (DUF1111 family)